ncbi:MFS transporter [Sphingomonas mucosissima]|uniref:Muropeptide transporter n=1 Tax=Sphingomonas mucosissima TaxID=370959 RepID=A0A245ZE29_9SPHN|nr:MFS transporter [Sphingomonas mucosissima]OWK28002.1 muropeptide transporter [Sphingomonas mucosissima]
MNTDEAHWSFGHAASILLPYTLRGTLLSFLYLILPAILRAGGTSLPMTSLSTLVFLPVGLSWLWAPLMDRTAGRGRRTWIVGALLVASAVFAALSWLDPVADYALVLTVALMVAAAAATIGTATDAAIIDGVAVRHRGWANALQAAGVALGGLAIGAVGIVYGAHGWAATSIVMATAALASAGFVAVAPLATGINVNAPVLRPAAGTSLLRDRRVRHMLLIVILSRAALHLPMGIIAAFQIDAGLSVASAALIGGTGGAAAGLIGAVLGGAIATKLPPKRAIIATLAAVATASLMLAASIALQGATPGIAVILALYVFLLTTPVFVAMHRQFMLLARIGRHASDMSVLTGSEFLSGIMIAATAGWIVQSAGYPTLFVLAGLSAFGGMMLVGRSLDEGS